MGAGLRLPVRVADVGLATANELVIPLPHVLGDRLTDGAKHAQGVQLVVLDVLLTGTLQQPQCGRCNVELVHAVLVNNVPVPGEVGVCWGPLKDDGCGTVQQWAVDDVGVAGDPAHVARGEDDVLVVNIKHVLGGEHGAQEVTRSGVENPLGLARRAGGVEQEQVVLAADRLWRTVGPVLDHLLVPPHVSLAVPWDVGVTCPLEDDDVSHVGTVGQRVVDNLLRLDDLPAPLGLVGGDDDLGVGVQDPVLQGCGGEAGKDHRVDGANPDDRHQGHNRLWDHRQVHGDRVALLHAKILQHLCKTAHVLQQLSEGDDSALVWLVGLVDYGRLVWVLDRPAVDTVVARVQLSVHKPRGRLTVVVPETWRLRDFGHGERL